MLITRRTPVWVLTGSVAATLLVGASLMLAPTRATEEIDPAVTGSIGQPASPAPAAPIPPLAVLTPEKGSAAFQDALKLFTDGGYAKAYAAANTLPDDVERRTLQWAAIYYGKGAIDAPTVQAFTDEAPDFASAGVFKTRLEQALIKADAVDAEIIKYLSGAMPNTLDAQIALAGAYAADGQKSRAASIARDIWVNQILDKTSEAKLLDRLGSLLTARDHWARAEHLMMNDRASAVERLFKYLTPAQKSLAVARNAVSRNAKDAKALLDAVDPALKTNPIYLFSRAQRAHQFQLWDDAIAFLDKGKASDPDAASWWYERQTLIRELLAAGDARRAYKAAAGYTAGPEGRLVEARFHAGWIALSFLGEPKAAVAQFAQMAKLSTLAESVTQANYWLGRARAQAGDAAGAEAAYTIAAAHPTVYYGLLARAALGKSTVEIRQMPSSTDDEAAFEARDLVRAIELLAANGENDMAAVLLRKLADGLETGGEFVLAARLAQKIDAHHLAITIADTADKRGMPLDLFSYPRDGLPDTQLAEIDKAAIYAVARQESRFQPNAVSRSGALGLMQLMPATAKETAAKLGLAYSSSKLTSDPAYNAQLGSSYLAAQLKTFDGSLVLAAAAYNAGAGSARKWIEAYGDPRARNVDPVVWVELIPFQETRKYVQKVIANYMIYRARLGGTQISIIEALHSIAG